MKQRIRNWLGIKDPVTPKDWTAEFERLEKDTWNHRQILKDKVKAECGGCHKTLIMWPLATEAYYVKDGTPYHVKCYEEKK